MGKACQGVQHAHHLRELSHLSEAWTGASITIGYLVLFYRHGERCRVSIGYEVGIEILAGVDAKQNKNR